MTENISYLLLGLGAAFCAYRAMISKQMNAFKKHPTSSLWKAAPLLNQIRVFQPSHVLFIDAAQMDELSGTIQ